MRTASVLAGCLAALALTTGCQKASAPPASPPAAPPAPSPAAPSTTATPAAAAAPAGPVAATKGLDAEGTLAISAEDRCPICGMYPAKNPKFAGAVELADGRTFYTCGTGCLLKAHLHPEVHLKAERSAIRRLVVQDYLGGKPIDAAAAIWIAGSDVVGPMGPAFVPLASEADAATFRERHGGRSTFRLSELDDARFQAMRAAK